MIMLKLLVFLSCVMSCIKVKKKENSEEDKINHLLMLTNKYYDSYHTCTVVLVNCPRTRRNLRNRRLSTTYWTKASRILTLDKFISNFQGSKTSTIINGQFVSTKGIYKNFSVIFEKLLCLRQGN